MPKQPPIPELVFIKTTQNHAEFSRKLLALKIPENEVREYAHHVTQCWFALASEHMIDAESALAQGRSRSAYSRSYYAAYNGSKAIRYAISGAVSLKGDDHGKAATSLPDDFPDVPHWSQMITQLYECRLYADYDNWSDSLASLPLSPELAVSAACDFLKTVKQYATSKLGLSL